MSELFNLQKLLHFFRSLLSAPQNSPLSSRMNSKLASSVVHNLSFTSLRRWSCVPFTTLSIPPQLLTQQISSS